jgi:glycosyltransferase involved in cell wall biosynthesis
MDKLKKILLIENSSEDFYKTRIILAKYLKKNGWDVFVLIPAGDTIKKNEAIGITFFEYNFNRRDKGLIQILKIIPLVNSICKQNKINIIHSFRFQPNLVNVLSNLFNQRKIIIHITGLGIAYSNTSLKYKLIKLLSNIIFQLKMIRANKIIVQNNDDSKDITFSKYFSKKFFLIKGSGVDINYFNLDIFKFTSVKSDFKFNSNDFICTCVTRLIWEKGVKEMTDAFENGISNGIKNARLLIIGWSDHDNPRHVDNEFIEKYKDNPNILFLGKIDDVRKYLSISSLYVYPSYYREGIPRGILEALSMKLPILTTNTPGCNLTVNNNGYLINPRSSIEIKSAVLCAMNSTTIKQMSNNSRIMAEKIFSEDIIFSEIEKLYL